MGLSNECLSDLGNCGNYNQKAPDALRAFYTMLSMANLNDMFRQMYEALDGATSHSKSCQTVKGGLWNVNSNSEHPSTSNFGEVSSEPLRLVSVQLKSTQ